MSKNKMRRRVCDFPNCTSRETKRVDIEISIFRGDDVVLWVCKEHRKDSHHSELLSTTKAKKQMGEQV